MVPEKDPEGPTGGEDAAGYLWKPPDWIAVTRPTISSPGYQLATIKLPLSPNRPCLFVLATPSRSLGIITLPSSKEPLIHFLCTSYGSSLP